MRKLHAAYLAGAVVVGLGAIAGVATYAPSLFGPKSATHQLTLQLPGGGSETIAYSGDVSPKVTFHTGFAADWPRFYDWTVPSFTGFDPVLADMNRHLLASMPLLMTSPADQPLSMRAIGNLPPGITSVVSQVVGNGVCTRFTQITKAAGDAKPRIVSQSSGDCGTGVVSAAPSQATKTAKAADLRSTAGEATIRSM